jgi:hypothetical protein
MDARLIQIILPLLIVLPILYWRMRKSMKPQPLKPKTLLIRPGFIILAAVMLMAASPPPRSYYIWFALAAALGGAIGWYWGKLNRLHLHPEDGTVMSTDSQAGVAVLVALVMFRYGVRAGIGVEPGTMHMDVAAITDISIIFSALLFSARGLEIYLRAQKLLQAPSE